MEEVEQEQHSQQDEIAEVRRLLEQLVQERANLEGQKNDVEQTLLEISRREAELQKALRILMGQPLPGDLDPIEEERKRREAEIAARKAKIKPPTPPPPPPPQIVLMFETFGIPISRYARKLDLSCRSGGIVDLDALIAALLADDFIRILDLEGNEIRDADVARLAKVFQRNTTLQEVWLGNNKIAVKGAQALANALQSNSTLHLLSLSHNQLGDPGAAAITAGVVSPNCGLRTLMLDSNQITSAGAASIAQLMKASPTPALSALKLASNAVADDGAIALATTLKSNSNIQEVDLHSNLIGNRGAAALAEMVRSNNIIELRVSSNAIGPEGRNAFAAALEFTRKANRDVKVDLF